MVFSESMTFNQNTSDNLNPADSILPLMKKTDEIIRVEEGASRFYTETIGHSWIAGSATNGIVGVNTGTMDGQQQVVGGAGRGGLVLVRVVNPNNTFREHFSETTFKADPCTADWDTTNKRLKMHSSSDHDSIYNAVATTSSHPRLPLATGTANTFNNSTISFILVHPVD